MRDAFPELLALDATRQETWDLLGCWKTSLPPEPGEDRTKLYQERFHREEFLGEPSRARASVEDEEAALSALGLSATIREATRSDLKRAAELINRTNQFNMCGSRTTAKDLEVGMGTRHSVIMAEASDRFGSMGVVGVMRIDWKPDRAEIPIFVLSCRAFGFGIEYALLNAVKALSPDDQLCVGHYKETQFNGPCRQLYPASGMKWDGTAWMGRVGNLRPDPAWMTVKNELFPRLAGRLSGPARG
jgi:FkbH-like protein